MIKAFIILAMVVCFVLAIIIFLIKELIFFIIRFLKRKRNEKNR